MLPLDDIISNKAFHFKLNYLQIRICRHGSTFFLNSFRKANDGHPN